MNPGFSDFNGLFLLLLATIIGLLAWSLKKLIAIDKALTAMQTWTTGHEKSDDERHNALTKSLARIWQRVDNEQR